MGPAHAILARAQREFFGKLIPDRGGGLAVKKKQFKPEHIAAILQQLDLGMPVAAVTRRTGISEQTFHRWKKA